jgi:hypothetical protein
MSNEAVTYLVAACAGVAVVTAYVGLILVPALQSYSRLRERIAAGFLSLYVLLALLGIGAGAGAAIVWFWDRISP